MAINLYQFETSQVNSVTMDKLGPTLDRKTTTLNGVVAQIASNIFKNDCLEGIKFFKGQVLRITEETNPSGSFLSQFFGNTKVTYKVRIPEVFPYLPIPNKIGNEATAEDQKIIDTYPDFVYEPQGFFEEKAAVGDIVNVTFGNLVTYKDGKVLNKVGAAPTGNGSNPGGGGTGGTSGLPDTSNFSGKKPATQDISGMQKRMITPHIKFDPQPDIEIIKLGQNGKGDDMWASQKVYDAFVPLKDAIVAAKIHNANIPFWSSMTRDIYKQKSIHNDYFNPSSKISPSLVDEKNSPKGQESSAWVKKSPKGPAAALPGKSPHENDAAIDVVSGPDQSDNARLPKIADYIDNKKRGKPAELGIAWKSPGYKWLSQNSYKFGFDANNGRSANVNEPWHYNYKPDAATKPDFPIEDV